MRKVIFVLMAIAGSVTIRAQSIGPSTLNSSGGSGPIGSYEFDWSVGEMSLVSTFSSSSIVVTQGVLQPLDAWPLDIGNSALLTQLKVFPNPAESIVNIQYSVQAAGSMTYRLMDVSGKTLESGSENVKQGTLNKQLNISSLACASYMLEVIVSREDGTNESTSFKIQKIK